MTDAEQVKALLGRHRATVEEAMDRFLPAPSSEVALIDEAMRYSLFAGGKRLRPALVLAVAEMLEGESANALPAACAIEMIHTYSLVHDDLPCMDDDDLRRGRPTCHVQYGEAVAVLAGDALSNAAFGVIADETADVSLVAPLIRELAAAAGTSGMIGGQVLDLISEGRKPDIDTVRLIHSMKTARLLAASVKLGAIAAGAQGEDLARISEYGDSIGLAFQIIDDILDEEGDASTLGKTAGKDREQEKMTFPACIGIEASRAQAKELVDGAIARLGALDRKGDLAALARYICARLN